MWWRVIAVFVTVMALIGVTGFFLMIWLVGPHGGVLPGQLRSVVLIMFWLTLLVAPFIAARRTYSKIKS